MITALAKTPFILCGSLCDHIALTAPTPPPHPEEREKYEKTNGKQERGLFTVLHAAHVWQRMVHVLNAIEIMAILCAAAQHYGGAVARMHPALSLQRLPHALQILLARLIRQGEAITFTRSFAAGWAIMLAGTLFRYAAFRRLGPYFTFHLSVRREHRLITNGPYALVRHPGYAGGLLFMWGTALCQAGPGSYWEAAGILTRAGVSGKVFAAAYFALLVYLTAGIFVRVPREDTVLKEEFGEQWEAWAKDTPYRLFPFIC